MDSPGNIGAQVMETPAGTPMKQVGKVMENLAPAASIAPAANVAPVDGASPVASANAVTGAEQAPPIARVTESVGELAVNRPRSTIFLLMMFLIVYVMWIISVYTLQGMPTGNKYLAISGIIIAMLVGVAFFTQFIGIAQIFTLLSCVLFIWFAVDTYKTYKKNGQTGMANVQVLMMISLLATIIISKFVLTGDGGLPEMISVFFTVVSFCLIYLIHNLEEQACPDPQETHYKELLANAALFIVIFSLTGKHALIALAISVAAFAYFSYAAKKITGTGGGAGDGSGDGTSGTGSNTEKTNLLITTFLIVMSALKLMFPSFSLSTLTNSRPVQIFANILTICALISFLVINVLYSMGFNKKTITGYLVGINGLIAFIMVMRGFMG